MLQQFRRSLENGVFCMILASFFFAIMGASVKISLREVPVYEAVFFRSIISAVLVATFIGFRKKSFVGNKPLLLMGRGFAGFIALNLNFYAISKISLGDATLLNQTSPLFVALFSVWFLNEKFSAKALILSLISFVGIALIMKPTFSHFHFAALAGLLGGIVAALAYVAISQLHESDSFLTMAFYFTAISSILSTPLMIHHAVIPTSFALLCLILAGISGTFGQLFLTYAYKNEEASWVAPFSYIAVIFSFTLGILIFNEIPDFYSLLGSATVIVACILLLRLKKKPLPSEVPLEIFE